MPTRRNRASGSKDEASKRSRNRASGSEDEASKPHKADVKSKTTASQEDDSAKAGSNVNIEDAKNIIDDDAAVVGESNGDTRSDAGEEEKSDHDESGDEMSANKKGYAKLKRKSMVGNDIEGANKEDKNGKGSNVPASVPHAPTGTLSKLAPKPAPPPSNPHSPPQPYAPYYPGYPQPYCQYYPLPPGMPVAQPIYPCYPPAPHMQPPPTVQNTPGSAHGKKGTASPWETLMNPYCPTIPSATPESTNYADASTLPDPDPDDRRNRGGVVEPFPEKLHRMLEYTENNRLGHVASFLPHGRAFSIRKPKLFVEKIMRKFFRQTRLTSFQRQLNLYGFKRISQGPDSGGYYHELFLRGRPRLSVNMQRTKVKGDAAQRFRKDPDNEPKFYAMPPISVPRSASSGDASASSSHVGGSMPSFSGAATMAEAGGPIAPAPKTRTAKVDPSRPVAQTPASDELLPSSTVRASSPSKSAATVHDISVPPSASRPALIAIAPQIQHPPSMYPMVPSHQQPHYPVPYGYFYPAMPIHPAPYTAAQQESSSPSPIIQSVMNPAGQPGPVMMLPNYSPGYHCPPYYPPPTAPHQVSGAPPTFSVKKSSTRENAGEDQEGKTAKKQAKTSEECDSDLAVINVKKEQISADECDPATDQKGDDSTSSKNSTESLGAK
mmetsp:Transcript_44562/g.135816  ORF Transcript_44562/g.135816 Transcript_44562/m.135816 type:complete len:664 (-) Transcript_44562:564-2555(-)